MTAMIDQASRLRDIAASAARNAPVLRIPGVSQDVPAPAPPATLPDASTVNNALAALEPAPPKRGQGAQTGRARVIAVTSGKGGVGKSNISVNLAVKFAQAGKEVVLLDADLGLANADVLCNVDLPSNLSHVIARRKTLMEVMVRAPGGFGLIGGASGLARMADLADVDRRHVVDALADLEMQTDVILIDTGAGISPNVLSFTAAADHVLVVTTPEPTAITDAYAVIKVLSREQTDRPVSLLVNQARTPNEARKVYERISGVARQFLSVSVLDAGYVLADEHVSNAVRKRMPFMLEVPNCPAAECISAVASRLERGVAPMRSAGFFRRMGQWIKR